MSSHFSGVSVGTKSLTLATYTVNDHDHAGRTLKLNKADGITVTLPASTGSGENYMFFVETTVTSVGYIIKVANASDVMAGNAIVANDAADTASIFEAGATADTITLNGTTTGGILGGYVKVTDVSENLWFVEMVGAATGTEATPFSAAVS